MQPLVEDSSGIIRFKANYIVKTLLDECQARARFGLNDLGVMAFTQADWEQFYQLIGYSLTGYHELSLVSDETAAEASRAARRVAPTASGCRDDGCPIHCGVERS